MTIKYDWVMANGMLATFSTPSPTLQNVSRETLDRFKEYVALLLKWNAKINLIGSMTEADIWSRHIEDSLQLVPLIPVEAKTMVDFGSGAGLPGLIIAIACPSLSITVVEQDQRKAAFLNEAKRILRLSHVTVEEMDIAHIDARFDVITARALSQLNKLLAWAKPCINVSSVCLFPKGANFQMEMDEAKAHWRFDSAVTRSQTNPDSAILAITNLEAI